MRLRFRPGLRLLTLLFFFLAGSGLIGGRLVQVQGLDARRFETLAADQRERRFVLPPQRGSILDRSGGELAMSLDMQTIVANPRFVPHDPGRDVAAREIAAALGVGEGSIRNKLASPGGFVYLARKVDPAVAARVRDLGIPGVETFTESKRVYPAGRLASQVIGFAGMDNEGLEGLELQYDSKLRGSPGELLIERDPSGQSIPSGVHQLTPPRPGEDIVLTIDREIQYQAQVALAGAVKSWNAKGGSVIVMDPRDGDILAMANAPDFDPGDVAASSPADRRNRAVVDVYEPGSASKVVTAAAALETRVVKPKDVLLVPDQYKVANRTFHDAHAHPTTNLTFADIIEESSNVGTIKVAQRLGKDRLYSYLDKFGYGRATGIAFPGESSGILPEPDKWWPTSMGTVPIGQGVAVSALQIASVYATVANRGVSVPPRLVGATVDAAGKRHEVAREESHRVIGPETATTLTRILLGVTEGEHGTARAAAIPGYQVAGKTGTAQKPRTDGRGYQGYIASFIGFAPASNPRLVVAVVLDDPSPIWGGVTAAPVFKDVMQFSLRRLGIGPGPVLPPVGDPSGSDGSAGKAGSPLPAPDRSGGVAPDPAMPPPPTGETAD
ncbi:MAG TPA: penicillin-binding protein 2 [Actinomycetota bacterium]